MLSVKEIGEKIAVLRKMINLSQARLSEMLGVSAQAVGKWERGESMPDIVTFGRLAEIFGVDLNYFGENVPVPDGLVIMQKVDNEEYIQKPGWSMSNSNWTGGDFSGLHGLAQALGGANIDSCKFINSELAGLILKGNNIRRSDFSHSNLKKCKCSGTNFERDIFITCDFSKSEFLRSGIKNCDFSGANLTEVVFKWSHLQNIKLYGATLQGTAFRTCQLSTITFDGQITDCSFENCDFAQVEFKEAIICNTFFKNCKLNRAKFIACKCDKLSYAFMKSCKADLSDVEIIE